MILNRKYNFYSLLVLFFIEIFLLYFIYIKYKKFNKKILYVKELKNNYLKFLNELSSHIKKKILF